MAALQIISLETTTPQLRAPASGDTYSAPRALDITPETLTGSSATSSLSIAQTWNTTGTPTAIDLNVTDTASNANSLLMDLRVGGTTKFRVTKFGAIILNDNLSYVGDGGGARARLSTGSSPYLGLASGAFIGFSASNVQVHDLILTRDAANTLAQRNGVNAQAFNIYGTFTDVSNYERLKINYDGVQYAIVTENAGTGTNRPLRLAAPSSSIAFDSANGVAFRNGSGGTLYWSITSAGILSSSTGTYFQMTEMTAPAAPAADRVRIYAEDNGSGKTRLMALFATGAAQVIAVEP